MRMSLSRVPPAATASSSSNAETKSSNPMRPSESEHVERCFLRQMFRYFMGRDETPADACTLAAMEAAYSESGSFIDVLQTLASSDVFLYRHDPVEE